MLIFLLYNSRKQPTKFTSNIKFTDSKQGNLQSIKMQLKHQSEIILKNLWTGYRQYLRINYSHVHDRRYCRLADISEIFEKFHIDADEKKTE